MALHSRPPPSGPLAQRPPLPSELRRIRQERCEADHLYAVLTTDNAARLDPHVAGIQRLLKSRNVEASVIQALQAAVDCKSSVVKHAIILFALHAETAFREYFAQHSYERIVGEFTLNALPRFVQAMLTGHYETLDNFVQDARSDYVST